MKNTIAKADIREIEEQVVVEKKLTAAESPIKTEKAKKIHSMEVEIKSYKDQEIQIPKKRHSMDVETKEKEIRSPKNVGEGKKLLSPTDLTKKNISPEMELIKLNLPRAQDNSSDDDVRVFDMGVVPEGKREARDRRRRKENADGILPSIKRSLSPIRILASNRK